VGRLSDIVVWPQQSLCGSESERKTDSESAVVYRQRVITFFSAHMPNLI